MQDRSYGTSANGARSSTIVGIERQVLSQSAAGSTVREVYTIRVPHRMPRRVAKRAAVRLVDVGRPTTLMTLPPRVYGRLVRPRAARRAVRVTRRTNVATSPPSNDGPPGPPPSLPGASSALGLRSSILAVRAGRGRSRRCVLDFRYQDASAASVLAVARRWS